MPTPNSFSGAKVANCKTQSRWRFPKQLPVAPDGFFALQDAKGRLHLLVEADRRTSTLKRFTLKLRAYAEYFRQRKHAEKFGINQIRGLLLERGITLRKGRCHVDEALPGIMEDASAKLSGALRVLLAQLKLESITCKCGSTKPMW